MIQFNHFITGFGVGDASASPTGALMLSIAQETFSRLTSEQGFLLHHMDDINETIRSHPLRLALGDGPRTRGKEV